MVTVLTIYLSGAVATAMATYTDDLGFTIIGDITYGLFWPVMLPLGVLHRVNREIGGRQE